MSLLFPASPDRPGAKGPTGNDRLDIQPVEVAMIAEGASIRVGPNPGDVLRVEDLAIGDVVWDMASGRLVDLDTLACATFGARELAEQGMRTVRLGPDCTIAIPSPRMRGVDATKDEGEDTPRVFYRLWPETRIHALVNQTPCLINPAKWA